MFAHTLLDVSSNGCCPILVEGLPGGNQTVSAGDAFSFDAPENGNITLTAQPGDSCQFGNWTVDEGNSTTENPITVTMDGYHTATATCIPLHTLSVTSNGCCPIMVELPEGNQTVDASGNATFTGIPQGTVITLEAVESGNCTFDYWETHSIEPDYYYEKIVHITIDADHSAICYSHVSTTYTLSVTSNGYCPITVELPEGNQTVDAGNTTAFPGIPENTSITLTAQSGVSCQFGSWTVDAQPPNTNQTVVVTMDSDHAATATCTPLYTLTVTNNGCWTVYVTGLPGEGQEGTWIEGNATFVLPEGTEVTLQAYDNDGIVFTGWYVDAEGSPRFDRPLTITMDADHHVRAVCVPSRTLYVSSNGCCPILVEGLPGGNQTVSAGNAISFAAPLNGNVTLTAQSSDSCQFDNWTIDNEIYENNPIQVTMDNYHDVTAWCTPLYTLTVTSNGCCPITVELPEGNQTVDPGNSTPFYGLPENTQVTLTAQSGVSCQFENWTVDDQLPDTNQTIVVTMDSDHIATAVCNLPEPTPIP